MHTVILVQFLQHPVEFLYFHIQRKHDILHFDPNGFAPHHCPALIGEIIRLLPDPDNGKRWYDPHRAQFIRHIQCTGIQCIRNRFTLQDLSHAVSPLHSQNMPEHVLHILPEDGLLLLPSPVHTLFPSSGVY